jgi:hypothetical protein
MLSKKLPPYGKQLLSLLERKGRLQNDIFLFIGEQAWQKGSNFSNRGQAVLVLPSNETPELYTWPVRGYDVLVIVTSLIDSKRLIQTVGALSLAGANIVRVVLFPDNNRIIVYRRKAYGI